MTTDTRLRRGVAPLALWILLALVVTGCVRSPRQPTSVFDVPEPERLEYVRDLWQRDPVEAEWQLCAWRYSELDERGKDAADRGYIIWTGWEFIPPSRRWGRPPSEPEGPCSRLRSSMDDE